MIYLFCNVGYGLSFIEAASELSALHGVPITVVLSAKRGVSSWVRQVLSAPRRTIRARIQKDRIVARYGLNALVIENVNCASFAPRVAPGDLGFIAGFNQIFRAPLLTKFQCLINFHPSLLPLYRGPVPSYWCIKHAETHSGFTMHKVTQRVDEGDILHQEVVPIYAGDDEHRLDERIGRAAAACFRRFLDTAVLRGEPWEPRLVDAYSVYKKCLDYASFP